MAGRVQPWWRHAVLGALVAGLALAAISAPGGVVLAVALAAAGVAGVRWTAVALAAAVLAGAACGAARLDAIDGAALAPGAGRVTGTVEILEPLRRRSAGTFHGRARVHAAGGLPSGVAVLVAPRRFGTGELVRVEGRALPLGPGDAYQRPRGARAALRIWRAEPAGRRGGLLGALDRARRRAHAALARSLPPESAALAAGMALGQDEDVPARTRDAFATSGLAHILAVSGQNVVLLCLLVYAAGAVANLSLRARLYVAIGLIAVYVPLTGAGPSIQRAGVMGAAGLVATLAGRPSSRWYALLAAAAVTLAVNPRAVGEPGWQLSFVAVAGLLAWAAPLRDRLARRAPRGMAEAAAVTIAATVTTAPLLAVHFDQVSLVSLPANLVAAPAVAPVMWLGMLAAAAAQLSVAAGAAFGWVAGPFVGFIAWTAHTAAGVPGAAAAVSAGPFAAAAIYAALVAATIPATRKALLRAAAATLARGRVAVVAVLATAVAVALATLGDAGVAPPAPGETVVSFLDVGQGDATLIQRDGAAVLFDTGPPDGPILQRLEEAGVERLDALVITHAQLDHEGAAPAILARIPTRLVLNGGAGWRTPVQAALPRTAVTVHAGRTVTVAGLEIRFLWPPPGLRPEGDPNHSAAVAHVRQDDFDLLLPADAESDVTSRLDLPAVEALKVAHHGSEDPGLPALLERLQPRFAAIEVGRRNRYGHPRPQTLRALEVVPRVIRTDRDGTVRLHVRGAHMWLERGGRPWG